MEDPLILFESLHYWDKQKEPSLHFNLMSLNVKPNADGMTVQGCKRVESIRISEHIWSTNQKT